MSKIDVDRFAPLVTDAIAAFSVDPEYGVAMATRAAAVLHKRELWAARLRLRQAAVDAILTCESGPSFTCELGRVGPAHAPTPPTT